MRIGAALVAGASLYGGSATLDGNAAVGSNTLNAATFGFAARPFSCRSTTCTCSPRRCAVRTARRLEHDMKIHTPKAGLAMKLLLRRAEADAIVG